MEIKFNVTGKERKALVVSIEESLGIKARYLGMPTAAYQVGDVVIDKAGTIKSDNKQLLEKLKNELFNKGFNLILEVNSPNKVDWLRNMNYGYVIPKDQVNYDQLQQIISQKEGLIKKAFNVQNLEVQSAKDGYIFEWFNQMDQAHDSAYSKFIDALCKLSITAKRINRVKPKEINNEKYAFRCFLLRLGFIGKEFKANRKILLENFEGSSSMKGSGVND